MPSGTRMAWAPGRREGSPGKGLTLEVAAAQCVRGVFLLRFGRPRSSAEPRLTDTGCARSPTTPLAKVGVSMWGISIPLLCTVTWLGQVPSATATPAPLPPRLATRQSDFFLPFVTRQSPSDDQRQVDLYCSTDLGRTWAVVASAKPAQRRFSFHAPADGEYWFLIRTRDNQREGTNPPYWPEMRVLVATSPPTVHLEAAYDGTGRLAACWEVESSQHKPADLAIRYRGSPTEPWQNVALDPARLRTTPNGYAGAVTWWPSDPDRPLEVRAEVVDEAGNRAVSQCRVEK